MLTFRRVLDCTALFIVAASLTACGGGGGYGGGGGMNMPVSGVGPSKLFAADSPHMAIGSLANPDPATGAISVDRTIMGSFYTGLSNNIGSLALDPALDYLYVGNGTSIRVFYSASMVNGDIPPSRVITGIGNTGSMFLDTAHDRLYVGDDASDVKVFSSASMASGAATPRHVTGMGTPIHGIAVDTTTKNILYVSNDSAGTHQISVFDNADTVTTAAPNRTITPTVSAVNQSVGGIFLDSTHDVLYVAGGSAGTQVMVFAGASTAHDDVMGATTPTKTLTGFATGIVSVVVDTTHDRLYAVGLNGHIYLVETVSMLSTGAVTAKDASLSGGTLTAVAVNPN
jgi:hypothetical protein